MGKIKLFPTPEYTNKQASDPVVPLVPCTGIFLGPSKSGKTVALISLILEQYKGVFERIYVFSPSVNIDDGWIPVKKYIEQDLGVNTEREQAFSGLVWAQALPKIPPVFLSGAVVDVLSPVTSSPSGQESSRTGLRRRRKHMQTCLKDLSPATSRRSWTTER